MSVKTQCGIASALIFLAITTAPALVCLSYLARNTNTHSCCPQEKPQNAVVAGCCVYSPAVTAHGVDVPVPILASAIVPIDPPELTSDVEPSVIPYLDTSPHGCNAVLRV